jgi:hypothetical protein
VSRRRLLVPVAAVFVAAAALAASGLGAAPPRTRPAAQHGGSLAYSTASADVIQPQPRPGSCHAVARGLFSEPDRRCTPGALNPAVKSSTIGATICRRGWTATVRPPEDETAAEKRASMAAYGDRGRARSYEYDHLVPLELGGAVNDARNLWPEPGPSPNPKDRLENALRRLVCAGRIALSRAQRLIADDWVAAYRRHVGA